MSADAALAVADWRRQVAELYARVRERRTDDPVGAHDDWRVTRDRLFAEHPQTPLDDPAGFAGIAVAPYDPGYVWAAPVDTDVERERFPVATSGGGTIDFVRFGRVELDGAGSLDVFWLDAYGGGVFLPLRDATAGDTTYGGGRYVLDTVKGADLGADGDRLVIDLNFAYHPSCRWSPRWSCPLAPPGNRLDLAVDAGELLGDG